VTAPRHLGINAVFLEPRFGGLDTYARALVGQLRLLAPSMRTTVWVSPRGRAELAREPWVPDVTLQVPPGLARVRSKAAFELGLLAGHARRAGVDLVHSLALTGPLQRVPRHVVTIADTTWFTSGDPDNRLTFALWKATVPTVARRAARVIAISRAGGRDVERHCRVPSGRIDVVPLGAGVAAGGAPPTPARELRERLGIPPGPIVLSVGPKRPNKNQLGLVRALPGLPGDAVLVLAGGERTPYEDEVRAEAARLGVAGRVAVPGFVAQADLEGLYAAATVVAVPSFNEGFGLPVLEAMARGVPVACSDRGSLPEVAGDAAVLFDPAEPRSIGEALRRVLGDAALRADLVARGRRRPEAFSWRRCAEGTLDSYARALAAGAGTSARR
jgi:glycosyltransferase involved in cell wall biosynthesis